MRRYNMALNQYTLMMDATSVNSTHEKDGLLDLLYFKSKLLNSIQDDFWNLVRSKNLSRSQVNELVMAEEEFLASSSASRNKKVGFAG